VYAFTGPDGVAHRLGNHNLMLKTYAGLVGMKTGYTKRAMHSYIAAATRDGRTMISVQLGAPGDTYGPAAAMLDRGFATPVSAEGSTDGCPPRRTQPTRPHPSPPRPPPVTRRRQPRSTCRAITAPD